MAAPSPPEAPSAALAFALKNEDGGGGVLAAVDALSDEACSEVCAREWGKLSVAHLLRNRRLRSSSRPPSSLSSSAQPSSPLSRSRWAVHAPQRRCVTA